MNRQLAVKAREARRLGREAYLNGGRNPYDFRPIGGPEFILWFRFVLGYMYALNKAAGASQPSAVDRPSSRTSE